MKTDRLTKAGRYGAYILAAVFALVPFHAFLTVWLGSASGYYDQARLWKEAVLLLLVPLAVVIAARTPEVWRRLRGSWLMWAMAAYVLLHLLLGAAAYSKGQVNLYALGYALIVNLRLVLVFAVAFALATRTAWLHRHWQKLVLVPAAAVVAFGLLQMFVLPADFLGRFGYGVDTIKPFDTVDQKIEYLRVQSTMRGANPLGAYLVVVVAALTVLLQREYRRKRQLLGIGVLLSGLVVLMATYSRSAYIGAAVAVLAAVLLTLRSRRARLRLAAVLCAVAVIAASLAVVFRENDRFENTFLHTDEHSASHITSNEGRLSALGAGYRDVLTEPFGRGPGTAGPASQHNVRPARIAENYYLQIGQEAGWAGLALFLVMNLLLARELWRRRRDMLCRVLLASLAGIALINLLLHAWTDDTLSILWWGLAGVGLGSVILDLSNTQKLQIHGKHKNESTEQPRRAKKPAQAKA